MNYVDHIPIEHDFTINNVQNVHTMWSRSANLDYTQSHALSGLKDTHKKLLPQKWKFDFGSSIETLPRAAESQREKIKTISINIDKINNSLLMNPPSDLAFVESNPPTTPKPVEKSKTFKNPTLTKPNQIPRDSMQMILQPEVNFKYVPVISNSEVYNKGT